MFSLTTTKPAYAYKGSCGSVFTDIPMHVPSKYTYMHTYIYICAFDPTTLPSTHTCACFVGGHNRVDAPKYMVRQVRSILFKSTSGT